jgi:hypothetical protein
MPTEIPVPDPTVLTTQQLLREILGVREILEARLDGMDKAIELIQKSVDKSPTVSEIYSKFKEKFKGVQMQFKELDKLREQSSKDGKIAIDAALLAAKELVNQQNASNTTAIGKSEASTSEQIKAMGVNIQTLERSFGDKINDLKDRINTVQAPLTRAEGHALGSRDVMGYIFGAVGMVVGILALVIRAYK